MLKHRLACKYGIPHITPYLYYEFWMTVPLIEWYEVKLEPWYNSVGSSEVELAICDTVAFEANCLRLRLPQASLQVVVGTLRKGAHGRGVNAILTFRLCLSQVGFQIAVRTLQSWFLEHLHLMFIAVIGLQQFCGWQLPFYMLPFTLPWMKTVLVLSLLFRLTLLLVELVIDLGNITMHIVSWMKWIPMTWVLLEVSSGSCVKIFNGWVWGIH